MFRILPSKKIYIIYHSIEYMAMKNYWREIYKKYKNKAICVDIEVSEFGGDISVIGIYIPKGGIIECQHFVKGINLTFNNLKPIFDNTSMIITFNGIKWDIPKIKSQFPGLISDDIAILDLWLFAKNLNLGYDLRTLENKFNIGRLYPESEKKGIAIKLWNEYKRGNRESLKKLLEYNKQDTVNLHFLAIELMNFKQ